VRALIETRLSDWAADNELPVAWENLAFTPPTDATGNPLPYLKFNLLPAQTRSDDLAGQLRAWSGIAQIAIFVPSGSGPRAAEDLVGQLDALYPCQTYIASTAIKVLIQTPVTAGNGFNDDAYYAVPAYFQYRADASLA